MVDLRGDSLQGVGQGARLRSAPASEGGFFLGQASLLVGGFFLVSVADRLTDPTTNFIFYKDLNSHQGMDFKPFIRYKQ
jgi:hypothetical protein